MTWKLTPEQQAKAQSGSKARSPWFKQAHCGTARAQRMREAMDQARKPPRPTP